jgi:hypothetical protein
MGSSDRSDNRRFFLLDWRFWFYEIVDILGWVYFIVRYSPYIIAGCLIGAGIIIAAQEMGYSYQQGYAIMTVAFFSTMILIGYRWIDW